MDSAKLSIDFSPRRRPRFSLLGPALLVFALLALGLSGWRYQQLAWDIAATRAIVPRPQGQPTPAADGFSAAARQNRKDELAWAIQLVDRLDAPWDGLLLAFQQANANEINLLSIEPDSQRQEVRLGAAARDRAALAAYLERVRKSAALGEPYLFSQQASQEDPDHSLRFVLRAHWTSSALRPWETLELPLAPSADARERP